MKIRGILGVLVSGCALVVCCYDATIGGKCNTTEDCYTELQTISDTTCVDGLCTCKNPEEQHCCFRSRLENCTPDDPYRCRPKEECDPMAPFIFPDAGADASDGG